MAADAAGFESREGREDCRDWTPLTVPPLVDTAKLNQALMEAVCLICDDCVTALKTFELLPIFLFGGAF